MERVRDKGRVRESEREREMGEGEGGTEGASGKASPLTVGIHIMYATYAMQIFWEINGDTYSYIRIAVIMQIYCNTIAYLHVKGCIINNYVLHMYILLAMEICVYFCKTYSFNVYI